MTKQAKRALGPPATHQPTKAEMEGVVAIDGTLDETAGAVLHGGARRKGPTESPPE